MSNRVNYGSTVSLEKIYSNSSDPNSLVILEGIYSIGTNQSIFTKLPKQLLFIRQPTVSFECMYLILSAYFSAGIFFVEERINKTY